MKFKIERTSILDNTKPCEEAKEETYNGVTVWFVEINTLEELLDFRNKYDRAIIIDTAIESPNIYSLEIYDNWRE